MLKYLFLALIRLLWIPSVFGYLGRSLFLFCFWKVFFEYVGRYFFRSWNTSLYVLLACKTLTKKSAVNKMKFLLKITCWHFFVDLTIFFLPVDSLTRIHCVEDILAMSMWDSVSPLHMCFHFFFTIKYIFILLFHWIVFPYL